MENTENIQGTKQTEERTFSQAELNAIVQQRIGEVKAKYGDYEELKEKAQKFDRIEDEAKTELQKATERADALQKEIDGMKQAESIRKIREEASEKFGVPASLLNGSTTEECEAQAQSILNFAKPKSYPSVKDGGEAHANVPGQTRDQFANWFNETLGGN